MLLLFLLLFYTVGCIRATNVTLSLNGEAPFSQTVQSIKRNALAREVFISLRPVKKCLQPTFRVRISGTALCILDLLRTEPDTFAYSYPKLIDEGEYFVEVIILLCNAFIPDAYTGVCLENVKDEKNIVA